MKNVQTLSIALVALCSFSTLHAAYFADSVISYTPGTNATGSGSFASYQNSASALGSVAATTGSGQFVGVVSPFNSSYNADQIVLLGQGGEITLHLGTTLNVGAGSELGVFTGVSLEDPAYPSGTTGNPATVFSSYPATISVSLNGSTWISLGLQDFNIPSNYYNDPANVGPYASSAPTGTPTSDFGKPFTGTLASFDGKSSYSAVLAVLNGSGGGTWFSLGGTGLSQVNYVRFTNASNATTNFTLDAVAINNASAVPTPEPGTLTFLAAAGALWLIRQRRKAHTLA